MQVRTAMQRTLTLAFALALIASAPAVAASQGHRPAVSATRPHQKPCPRRRGCHWIEISSFQFGVARGVNTPSRGASDREGSTSSIGELTVHKPKRKVR